MPTKTKLMARKASVGETAPLAKQAKKEDAVTARVILDSDKVELATKELARIPKKGNTESKSGEPEITSDTQVSKQGVKLKSLKTK